MADPLQTIQISKKDDHFTYASSLLELNEARSLEGVLQRNKDVFVWTHSNMLGIHPSIASHQLNILPFSRPIHQKVQQFYPDRQKIIQNKINKLLIAEFIKEVKYPDWLANVVVVPKTLGKWRVCVDYTNLNDAYPKDNFPLPPNRPNSGLHHRNTECSPSYMPFSGTIRSLCIHQMKKKLPS